MRLIFISLLITLISVTGFTQTQKLNVAVNDLRDQGIEKASAQLITDRLRSELFNTGAFTVLEREQMESILKEQGFQQAGCVSDQCAVEVGQLLGVTHMIVGSIGQVGQTFTINLRMIEVGTGKVVFSTNTDCKCPIDDVLSRSTVELAQKLAKNEAQRTGAPVPVVEKPAPPAGFGLLKIETRPSGATLSLNNSALGNTPFKNEKMPAGQYRIKIELQDYAPLNDSVSLANGGYIKKSYILSLADQSAKVRSDKRKLWIQVGLGAGAAILAGAGLYANQLVQAKIDENTKIADDYAAGQSNLQFDVYASQYEATRKGAKDLMLMRNGLYAASAVAVVGLGVTFFF